MEKKIVLSGIQPSGVITLGNYVGALRNWAILQREDRYCFYCVVNLHAITVRQDSEALLNHTIEAAAILLACGVDPVRSALFIPVSYTHLDVYKRQSGNTDRRRPDSLCVMEAYASQS